MKKIKLNQNLKRIQAAPKFCDKHKMHYIDVCPYCDEQQATLKIEIYCFGRRI